jgi:hypothetical protein
MTAYISQYPASVNSAQFGGGIVSSLAYLSLNLGRNLSQKMDGGLYAARRWSKTLFNDVLCRQAPTLRLADVTALDLVMPTNAPNAGSAPPFRSGQTCMSCHGSLDPMAYAVRNFSYSGGSTTDNSVHMLLNSVGSGLPALPTVYSDKDGFPFVNSDLNFYQRSPTGMLRYRSYDGTLVDVPVTGAAGLGAQIANTNDLYACAASRYFRFFTGINVNLQDPGGDNSVTLGVGDQYYLNKVTQTYAPAFKQSQSLQSLIRAIISDPIYQKASMRDEGN